MRSRAGFTLVELLVASLIGAVLVTGLWALLRTYERLFTGGEVKIERAQLVRTVLDQLTDDLQSAIADNAASPSGGSAAVRRFGLFGSAQALQVDVLQLVPTQGLHGPLGPEEERSSRARSPRVPELHTVQWRFEAPEEEEKGRGRSGAWSGLVRRELDWETPAAGGPGAGASRRGAGSALKGLVARRGGDPESFLRGRIEVDADDPAILWVPEVVDVNFRYFDGTGWSDQWNSLARKSLPLAVAVTIQIRTGEVQETVSGTSSGGRAHRLENVGPEKVPESVSDTVSEAPSQAHRLLVALPTTSLARRAEVEAPAAAAPPPVVVFRAPPLPSLPAPPAASGPPPSVSLVLPDQWMRTGQ
jgi:prepilin-type N-terminal cleavage/methylation domain-containing protein